MKKVQFKSTYSQYFFLAPQLLILLIFLYWPIIQTFKDAFTMQDAFGFSSQFAGFDNFLFIFSDPSYLTAFKFTIMYSFIITLITGSIGLLLAVQANKVMHGKNVYKTLKIKIKGSYLSDDEKSLDKILKSIPFCNSMFIPRRQSFLE